jgi:hypothetical protein
MLKEAAEPPGVGHHSVPALQTASPRCIKAESDALKVRLEQSTRYHQRRGWFYGRLHNITILAVVVLGWITFSVIEGHTIAVFGFGVAVLGALGLVLHFSHRVEKHEKLSMLYSRLASEVRMDEQTLERLQHWLRQERDMAANEPPVYWGLKAACCNEVLRARGGQQSPYNISLLPRLLVNFVRFDRDDFPRRASRE